MKIDKTSRMETRDWTF